MLNSALIGLSGWLNSEHKEKDRDLFKKSDILSIYASWSIPALFKTNYIFIEFDRYKFWF